MELRKTSIILIAAVLGISLFFAFQLRNLRFNYELERFFPLNNESTVFFQQFQSTFGNDSDYLMVGLRNEAGIFDQDFLRKADSLYLELKKTRDGRIHPGSYPYPRAVAQPLFLGTHRAPLAACE
jgi:predicted RND superfamily exporter protein